MGYAKRNKMSDVLANAQFFDIQGDEGSVDMTSQVRLYGVTCDLYFQMKKTRPDLCPTDKKNFFALGCGETKQESVDALIDRLVQFSHVSGLLYSSNKIRLVIIEMIKSKMISLESANTPQGVWTGIRLLKIAE